MLTYYFQLTGRKKKNIKRYVSLFLNGNKLLHIGLLFMFCSSYSLVQSQTYITRTDTIDHTDPGRLKQKRTLSERYRTSVIAASQDKSIKDRVPFYPYVTINVNNTFLPPPPFRIYLGKLTTGKINDYILVVVPCKAKDPQSKSNNIYNDILTSGLPGRAQVNSKWYSIRVSTLNNTKDKVTYTQIARDSAIKYVHRFDSSMVKIGLGKRFPTCFVFKSIKDPQLVKSVAYRIKLQPVIKTHSTSGIINPQSGHSYSGGSKSIAINKKFLFQFSDSYALQDVDGGANLCCEAPPENGNSISN